MDPSISQGKQRLKQVRSCTNPKPANGGKDCEGEASGCSKFECKQWLSELINSKITSRFADPVANSFPAWGLPMEQLGQLGSLQQEDLQGEEEEDLQLWQWRLCRRLRRGTSMWLRRSPGQKQRQRKKHSRKLYSLEVKMLFAIWSWNIQFSNSNFYGIVSAFY